MLACWHVVIPHIDNDSDQKLLAATIPFWAALNYLSLLSFNPNFYRLLVISLLFLFGNPPLTLLVKSLIILISENDSIFSCFRR